MSAVATLRAARETLSDPDRWTQDEFARNAHGASVLVDDDDAVCWCALGALELHEEPATRFQAMAQLRLAAERLFGLQAAQVNDRLGHAAVLQMYDRAIALAEAEARP